MRTVRERGRFHGELGKRDSGLWKIHHRLLSRHGHWYVKTYRSWSEAGKGKARDQDMADVV